MSLPSGAIPTDCYFHNAKTLTTLKRWQKHSNKKESLNKTNTATKGLKHHLETMSNFSATRITKKRTKGYKRFKST